MMRLTIFALAAILAGCTAPTMPRGMRRLRDYARCAKPSPPLWDRIKEWICANFGHWKDGKPWEFAGKRHECCKRCRRIVSAPVQAQKKGGE